MLGITDPTTILADDSSCYDIVDECRNADRVPSYFTTGFQDDSTGACRVLQSTKIEVWLMIAGISSFGALVCIWRIRDLAYQQPTQRLAFIATILMTDAMVCVAKAAATWNAVMATAPSGWYKTTNSYIVVVMAFFTAIEVILPLP